MLNETYEQGAVAALGELEKFAGEEFTEKVAGKMDALKGAASWVGRKAKKHTAGRYQKGYAEMKGGLSKSVSNKPGATATQRVMAEGGNKRSIGKALKGAARFSPEAAVAGGTGAYLGTKD